MRSSRVQEWPFKRDCLGGSVFALEDERGFTRIAHRVGFSGSGPSGSVLPSFCRPEVLLVSLWVCGLFKYFTNINVPLIVLLSVG